MTVHRHHFVPRPSGQRYGYTDWEGGVPVRRTEPINEQRCDCGAKQSDQQQGESP